MTATAVRTRTTPGKSRSLREHMQYIYDTKGKRRYERAVLDDARKPSSPIHERFTWDDTAAAKKWRLEEARQLIKSVKIVIRETPSGKESSVRAFHAVPTGSGREHTYLSTEDLRNDPVSRTLLLREMERDWKALKERYSGFKEFTEMVLNDLD